MLTRAKTKNDKTQLASSLDIVTTFKFFFVGNEVSLVTSRKFSAASSIVLAAAVGTVVKVAIPASEVAPMLVPRPGVIVGEGLSETDLSLSNLAFSFSAKTCSLSA